MYISEFLLAQSVWLQDIPKRPGAISRDLKVDDFPAAFGRVLDALGAREGLRALRQDVGYFSQSLFGSPVDLNNKHPSIPLRSTSDLACGWDFSKVSKVFGILQCGLSTCLLISILRHPLTALHHTYYYTFYGLSLLCIFRILPLRPPSITETLILCTRSGHSWFPPLPVDMRAGHPCFRSDTSVS